MKKTNNIFHLWLLVALVCGLSLGVTSCKDDDEEKIDERIVTEDGKTGVPDSLLTEQERYQMACQSAVISTMRNLAGLESVTPDVVNETHEPTYGMTLDDLGATVRVKKCEGTEAAEQSFRAIAGLDSTDAARLYTPTADGYVLNLTDLPILKDGKKFTLGTLTFHRDGGPRRYGWVDVDIPCIPHLERIDYLSPDAFPDNAGGDCPYQVGDIVFVEEDHNLCSGFYVCVATNGNRSTLCHMNKTPNPGGDESINFDDDDEGCWIPYNNKHGHATTFEDIQDYACFMAKNKSKVANIKAFMEGKAANKKPRLSGKLWHIFPDGFNNDKGVVFNLNDGQSAYVYYDAYFGSSAFWDEGVAFDWRYAKYALVPNNCTAGSQVQSGEKKYVFDSDWDDWLGGNDYTMNVIHAYGLVSDSEIEYRAQQLNAQ